MKPWLCVLLTLVLAAPVDARQRWVTRCDGETCTRVLQEVGPLGRVKSEAVVSRQPVAAPSPREPIVAGSDRIVAINGVPVDAYGRATARASHASTGGQPRPVASPLAGSSACNCGPELAAFSRKDAEQDQRIAAMERVVFGASTSGPPKAPPAPPKATSQSPRDDKEGHAPEVSVARWLERSRQAPSVKVASWLAEQGRTVAMR